MGFLDLFRKKGDARESAVMSGAPPRRADEETRAFNAAAELLLDKRFDECIAAYQALAEWFPRRESDCAAQIGAARYFLGQYDLAIEAYVKARAAGADEELMDDNIWEACEAAFRKSGERRYADRYRELCADGQHLKAASQLLA